MSEDIQFRLANERYFIEQEYKRLGLWSADCVGKFNDLTQGQIDVIKLVIQAIEAERERCAKIAEHYDNMAYGGTASAMAERIARRIRSGD